MKKCGASSVRSHHWRFEKGLILLCLSITFSRALKQTVSLRFSARKSGASGFFPQANKVAMRHRLTAAGGLLE